MLGRSIKHLVRLNHQPCRLVVACGTGLLLGVVCLQLSSRWALLALAGGGLAIATLKRPEIAVLGILAATSSIVFEERLPLIPIGVGSLHIPDVLLFTSFGLIVLRWLAEPGFKIVRTPLDLPLLAFWSVALLSTFLGVLQSRVELRIAIRAIRVVSYYLTFFIVTNLVQEENQLRLLLRGLFLLATIVAATMGAQFVLGESASIVPGRVETLTTQGSYYQGVTRIVAPGRSLLLVMFVAATVALVMDRLGPISVVRFLHWGLLGMGLIVTFLRSYWVVMGVVLLLLAYLVRGRSRQRLVGWALAVLLLATIVVLSASADPESRIARVASASFARLGTLGRSETLGESSLQWRYMENRYALLQIPSHPLLGVGLGARYRPRDPRFEVLGPDDSGFDPRTHIHNGHLGIMVKTGLLGYLCLMWLSLVFLLRGLKYWRIIPDPQMRGIVLGFTSAYLGVLIGAVVNSTFIQWYWTPVIGIMMAVNEVALGRTVQEKPCFRAESWQDTRKEA